MSSTVVQKQVGQTMVQLPQVRHRADSWSQTGLSRLRANISCKPAVSRDLPICPLAFSEISFAVLISKIPAFVHGIFFRSSAPVFEAASVTKQCLSPSMTSVRARSNPAVAFGPLPIDAQKHVAPAFPQFTAIVIKFLRAAM
jgi:hypothetical protein